MADIRWINMAETIIQTILDLKSVCITFDFILKLVIEFAKIRGTVTQFD